jgi:multiple sugar transport system permease protein
MKSQRVTSLSAYVVLGLLTFFFLFPIFWSILTALKTRAQTLASPPLLFFQPTLENFRIVIAETPFFRYLGNSALVSVVTTVIVMALSLPAAYSFSRLKFRGDKDILFYILSMRMTPGIALVVPYFLIFQSLGLIDNPIVLILVYLPANIALAVWLLKSTVDNIPLELDEAARIDGCSRLTVLRKIIFPVIGPGAVAVAIVCFIACWNEFLFAFMFTREYATTLPVGLLGFIGTYEFKWNQMCAEMTLMMIPVIIACVIVRKFLMKGFALALIKG